MKFHFPWLPFLAAVVSAAPLLTRAQGPLPPPGPPAPTMKTLLEVEPRTHITSLPYTITTSGSYYLTTNLNGGGGAGLVVQAGGVTVDLRGFSILNCTAGISAAAGVSGVAVHNGMVRGCSGAGIDLGAAAKCRLEDVIVCFNGGDGARVGAASIVTLTTALGNGAQGLVLDHGGKIFNCVAQSNSASGIVVTSNCQVNDNTCTGNGAGAGPAGVLTTGNGNRVEGNSCNDSAAHGFKIQGAGNLVIRNNACGNAAGDFSISAGNNYGQVLLTPGAAFVNANPWANFGCAGLPGPCATAADCNDANPCTTDVCMGSVCTNTPIPGCGPCATAADCNDNNACTTDICQGGQCQHNAVANGQACNDGNACTVGEVCVNGTCSSGTPTNCDDANPCTTDTCDPTTGNCSHTPIPGCTAVCGNGIVEPGEACDDGNTVNGDGCSAICGVQPGYNCTGSPSVCTTICGDGIVAGPEQCDDANTNNGDGCSSTCQIEICVNGSTAACYSGPPGTAGVGVCAFGVQTCIAGNWGPCVGEVLPTPEICNGMDDDCDGLADEGNPNGGAACSTGLQGVCASGTTVCLNGAISCLQNVQPSSEVCDGLDNNCNGVVDDGNPGGGVACSTGQLGVCAPGTTACQSGALVCVRNVNPSPEICNNKDDNCDGIVDNGATCPPGLVCSNGACISP